MQSEQPSSGDPGDQQPDPNSTAPTELHSPPQSEWLPSLPSLLPLDIAKVEDLTQLAPGQRLGDFLIRRVIGRGGFAAVYLALQWSLDREVALKITIPDRWQTTAAGEQRGEGQHLAQLDHPNIVRVYQQTTEPHTGAQLLCMQYVSGTTLEVLIGQLKQRAGQWTGADWLDVLDRLSLPAAPLEASAWGERQALEQADHIETVCRLGSQLASALQHAHARGIFHRDIKPANVLVSRYGQPLLADFNLATQERDTGKSALIGGTLIYMSPEHLEAFRSHGESPAPAVERLGDIYSLGILLWQTSTGELPFCDAADLKSEIDWSTRLQRMAQRRTLTAADDLRGSLLFQRQTTVADHGVRTPSGTGLERDPSLAPSFVMLGQILRKCLRPAPSQRYRSARSLRQALEGLVQLHAARKASPSIGRWIAVAHRFPITTMVLAGLVPHVIASALQITYNLTRVLEHFQPAQIAAFMQLLWWANPIIYGGCLVIFARYLWQILPTWQRLQACDPTLTERETRRARDHVLRLPRRAATIAGLGWLLGSMLFPAGVIVLAGPLPWVVLVHFLMSFLLAGLISATYSAFLILLVTLRVFYLNFWLTPTHFHRRAVAELAPLERRLDMLTFLAGSIPLAGAAALIFASPRAEGDSAGLGFRVLAVLLILAGGIGFSIVGRAVAGLRNLMRTWAHGSAGR